MIKSPFLNDSEYRRSKVPMTKEEIRWLSLIKLNILPHYRVLDIGAGSGSITIGAALMAHQGHVIAVEKNPVAVSLIKENATRHQCSNIEIIEGTAPESIDHLQPFHSIFVGGSSGNMTELIKLCNTLLLPSGRLVINTVTIENNAHALEAIKNNAFENLEVIQVSISKGKSVGTITMWEAQNPITILSATRRNP